MSSIVEKKTGTGRGHRKGFALITAILAIMILLALGYLAITVTTGDLSITSRIVGEKKALSASEAGIHRLMETFDAAYFAASEKTNVQVDASTDPGSRYTIDNIQKTTLGPKSVPLPGFSAEKASEKRYQADVTGENTKYNSSVQVLVGIGYASWGGASTMYE